MRMPVFLWFTISFIFGIWAQWMKMGFFLLIPIIPLFIYTHRYSQKKWAVLTALFFFFSGAGITRHKQIAFSNFYLEHANSTYSLIAKVQDITQVNHKYYRYRLTLYVKHMKKNDDSMAYPLKKTVEIYVRRYPDCQVGDIIEVDGLKIKKIGSEKFTHYLMRSDIIATFFPEKYQAHILYRPKISLERWFFNKRKLITQEIKNKLSEQTYTMFSTIFLGNKQVKKKQLEETKKTFKIWGISHHLARSGLHLVIFLLFIEFLLRLFPISYTIKQLIALILASCYYIYSWSSLSFIRAFLTFFYTNSLF